MTMKKDVKATLICVAVTAAMLFFGFRNAPISIPSLVATVIGSIMAAFMMSVGRIPFLSRETLEVKEFGSRFIYGILIVVLVSLMGREAPGPLVKHNLWIDVQCVGIISVVFPCTLLLLSRKNTVPKHKDSARN